MAIFLLFFVVVLFQILIQNSVGTTLARSNYYFHKVNKGSRKKYEPKKDPEFRYPNPWCLFYMEMIKSFLVGPCCYYTEVLPFLFFGNLCILLLCWLQRRRPFSYENMKGFLTSKEAPMEQQSVDDDAVISNSCNEDKNYKGLLWCNESKCDVFGP